MAVKQGARQDLFEYSRRGDVVLLNTWLNNNKGHHHKRSMLSLFRPTVSSSPGWLCALKDTGNGYTALHQAALHGQVEICRELISADVQLIEARDRRGCLPVHLAAWNGHVAVVQQLLFTLPDCHSPIVDAVNNAKESALHLAVKHGHTNVVTLLLQKRCNVQLRNCKGENALDIAARLGQAQICRLLIGHRPELICQSAVESFSTPSSHNDNINVDVSTHPICVYPLHLAARHGHVDVISILANAGFQLDFVTEEGSALHLAAVYGKVNAVCLLLEYGISCEIRDSHGRTVLQLLAEHEQNKASDLTQLMQARDCWAECRRIIQAHVDKKNKAFMCGETTRNDDHVYCNVPIISSKTTNTTAISGDVIWRPKDVSPSSKDQGHRHHSNTNCSSIIYHPISIQADLVNLGNLHDDMTISSISTLSLATTLTPRDTPSTSPMIRRATRPDHSPIDSLPLLDHNHLNLVQRSPCQLREDEEEQLTHQPCSYQAPLAYDTWTPPALKYDNLCTKNIVHLHKAYDNVPANLLVYDNSPSPGHRRWDHACSSPSPGHEKWDHVCSSPSPGHERWDHVCSSPSPGHRRWDHSCSSSTSPCYASSPIPPAKPPRMRVPFSSTIPIEEGSISPTSTIIYNPVLDSVIETIQLKENGSAPLAVAEEIGIGVSTSTSIVSSLNSPSTQRPSPVPSFLKSHFIDRQIVAKEEQISLDDQRGHFDCPMVSPPSPSSSQAQILDTLCAQPNLSHRLSLVINPNTNNQILTSPASTECSDTIDESSCSLPLISSHFSSTSSSPLKTMSGGNIVNGQYGVTRTQSLNENSQWKEIDQIMQSFGESVSAGEQMASIRQKASDFHDYDGNALKCTIQQSDDLQHKQIENVLQWLNDRGVLPRPRADEIAQILEKNGFDRVSALKETLDQITMDEMELDKSIQYQLIRTMQSLPNTLPSADDFVYASDWLLALGLTDYLNLFIKAGYSRTRTLTADLIDVAQLKALGIRLPGHYKRLMVSMKKRSDVDVKDEREVKEKSNTTLNGDDRFREPISSSSNGDDRVREPISLSSNGDDRVREAISSSSFFLNQDRQHFSVFYLGSVEVSNLDGAEECNRAMLKLKRSIRAIAKIPQVQIELSSSAVLVLNEHTKMRIARHRIDFLRCVTRDNNFFAYISRDGDRDFCHVFCVLTEEQASDVTQALDLLIVQHLN